MNTEIINIKIKNNVKLFNNQTAQEILKYTDENEDKEILNNILSKVTTENEFIDELKKIMKIKTPVSILRYILLVGNLSVSEANPILEKVLYDEEKS